MNAIDKRKNYYLTIDTETANGIDDALVYDIGGAIHDKNGNVYETFSLVIRDIYDGMKYLMNTCYYAEKLPRYEKDLKAGLRTKTSYFYAKDIIYKLCKKYNVKAIIAHNMRFDYLATARTQRYLTKSKYRYFLPYGIELWDTLKMAQDTICKQKSYLRFCEDNGYFTKSGKPRATAEILHRYLTKDNDFAESHTALEDVLIEKDIFAACERQHKKMRRLCFMPRELTLEEKLKRGWEVE